MCKSLIGLNRCKALADMQAKEDNEKYVVIQYNSGHYNYMKKDFAEKNNFKIVYETI